MRLYLKPLKFVKPICKTLCINIFGALLIFSSPLHAAPQSSFHGKYFQGEGDAEYLQLLDTSRRMFAPDPELQNMSMIYITNWNGLLEGPTWDAWWIQN